MTKIQARQDNLEEEMIETKNEIKEIQKTIKNDNMKKQMEETKNELKDIKDKLQKLEMSTDNQATSNANNVVTKESLKEEMDIERRKMNVVIMGMKEDLRDEEVAKDMLAKMAGVKGVKSIEVVERIGKKETGKVRPVRIRLNNIDAKYDILKAGSKLKNWEEYKKTYVVPDRTKKQQAEDKALWGKLKDIRDGGETSAMIKKGANCKKGKREGGGTICTTSHELNSYNNSNNNNTENNLDFGLNNIKKISYLNCIYTNARSILSKLDELKLRMIQDNIDIVGITETWLHPDILDSELFINGYKMYRKDRKDFREARAGGVLLYIRDSLISNFCEDLNKDCESLFCKIKTEDRNGEFKVYTLIVEIPHN